MTGDEMNDAIVRRAKQGWTGGKRSFWLIDPVTRLVTAATENTPGAAEGFGIFDGRIIGEDELRNARASGRIRPVS